MAAVGVKFASTKMILLVWIHHHLLYWWWFEVFLDRLSSVLAVSDRGAHTVRFSEAVPAVDYRE